MGAEYSGHSESGVVAVATGLDKQQPRRRFSLACNVNQVCTTIPFLSCSP
jgi:hypothetical protein